MTDFPLTSQTPDGYQTSWNIMENNDIPTKDDNTGDFFFPKY